MCIIEKVFPDVLKISKVVPVQQRDSLDDSSNHRRTAIIPLLEKNLKRNSIISGDCNYSMNINIGLEKNVYNRGYFSFGKICNYQL